MKKQNIYFLGLLTLIIFSAIIGSTVFAAKVAQDNSEQKKGPAGMQQSGISGTIASISGTTITLESADSYKITINASNASVKRNISATSTSSATSKTISVSDLKVGDAITIKGDIVVTASQITAGTVKPEENGAEKSAEKGTFGAVTAISGTTITMTSKIPASGSSAEKTAIYTVNAASATIKKGLGENAVTAAISDIAVGSNISVEGTISGTNITATTISIANAENQDNNGKENGFWSRISDFFGKIFGKNK